MTLEFAMVPNIEYLSDEEINAEIARLEREHGTYEDLAEKAATDMLTVPERAALRRLDALRFLGNR